MKIGRYRIQRQIAEGGQGRVLLGHDPRLKRRVAIKLYRLPDQRESRRQALREARRSARLDSPRITRVYDVLVAGDDLAVIMEYVPGCDLREVLRNTRLSLAAALFIASDIAAALAAARLSQTVHGDIKPANVLIARSGRAMLADFGVALVDGGSTAVGFSRGALTPEHVRGESLCFASDMFALGVLIYHMVSGVRPFTEGEAGEQAMCEGRFLPLSSHLGEGDIPAELDALVSALLAPDPRYRPDSLHAVRQVLRAVAVALPLGDSAPVRSETRAFYRSETRNDLPPALLSAFGGESAGRRVADRIQALASRRPLLTALGGVSALALGIAAWWLRPSPCLELEAPQLRVDGLTTISADIGRNWLQTELRQGVETHLTRVRTVGLLGDTGPRVIGRTPQKRACAADHRLRLALDCRRGLCLLSLQKDASPAGGGVPLYADASLEAWRSAIHSLVVTALPR
ncbi:serine/threonine-protein kinase [Chromatocurvus halotolerans]|uniref:Serine/threonine protein kinase n=1 Tax=Chromatocurvus halotolerans TaxID=1132028 RepID=A0A4R2LA95_9GAMM|nr:serine/threonine-protein kinase [Chromatocurvus halotolerans]TCO76175.1 serine/threonine protein kinase [Chromatocurvus halotolerans]